MTTNRPGNAHVWAWMTDERQAQVHKAAGSRRASPLMECRKCLMVMKSDSYYRRPGETAFCHVKPRPECIPLSQSPLAGMAAVR